MTRKFKSHSLVVFIYLYPYLQRFSLNFSKLDIQLYQGFILFSTGISRFLAFLFNEGSATT